MNIHLLWWDMKFLARWPVSHHGGAAALEAFNLFFFKFFSPISSFLLLNPFSILFLKRGERFELNLRIMIRKFFWNKREQKNMNGGHLCLDRRKKVWESEKFYASLVRPDLNLFKRCGFEPLCCSFGSSAALWWFVLDPICFITFVEFGSLCMVWVCVGILKRKERTVVYDDLELLCLFLVIYGRRTVIW